MARDDYVIICGDFGGVWSGGQDDDEKLDWLSSLPFLSSLWMATTRTLTL